MDWDDYNSNNWKDKLRDRLPVIAAATAAVIIVGGFTWLLTHQASNDLNADGSNKNNPGQNILTGPTTTSPPTTQALPAEELDADATDADKNTAIKVATDFVNAWANPELPQQQWFEGLRPYLAVNAFNSFESVDPSNVPSTTVTGQATVEAISALSATVIVPTDAGRVRVQIDNDKKVSYIEPATGSRPDGYNAR